MYVFVADYPWRPPFSNLDSNVVKWLFLPDHMSPPNPLFLLCMTPAPPQSPHNNINNNVLIKAGGSFR